MTKNDTVEKIIESVDISKKDAMNVVKATFDAISDALVAGEKVAIPGFGSFEVRERAARKGRNPQTGAQIDIPASRVTKFKASLTLKNAVKNA